MKIYFQSIIFHTCFVFLQMQSEFIWKFPAFHFILLPKAHSKKIYVLILVGHALQSWEYCQTIRRKQIGWKKSNKGERWLDSLSKRTMLDIFSQVFSFKFQKTVQDIKIFIVSEIIEIL